jgi:hypothetical protein
MAAPIKGDPGMLVIAFTATWKAGTDFATPPNTTTAAVLPIAIIAPIVPVEIAPKKSVDYFLLTR